jgi:hypothetical protein
MGYSWLYPVSCSLFTMPFYFIDRSLYSCRIGFSSYDLLSGHPLQVITPTVMALQNVIDLSDLSIYGDKRLLAVLFYWEVERALSL